VLDNDEVVIGGVLLPRQQRGWVGACRWSRATGGGQKARVSVLRRSSSGMRR
jgi:hypothetical protein